jgi:DNA repair exonuclease SbcCD nuclease subunit
VPSFAHLADIHIGAFRQPTLQKLVLDAFNSALDTCLQRKVDFIIVSGDLFDSNIPDMGLVNSAVKKMREVKESGIQFYVIYRSHDFSPTQTSIVDILESAGLFAKTTKGRMDDGKLKLEFTVDERTGAKLCGISGRRLGIEKEYYEVLDRESLEKEPGFKIFMLHGALTEYKPAYLAHADSLPLSLLPKGFDYYAGGHLHEELEEKEHGFQVAYPGALFGADYSDLERSAKGIERGFFVVTFSDKLEKVEFVSISVCEFELREYDAMGKNSTKVQNELLEMVKGVDAKAKVFLFKVTGEMSGGKTSDIDFQQLKKMLKEDGALEVLLNYQQLSSKEYTAIKVVGEDIKDIEDTLFKENIGTIRVSNPKLKGQRGIKLSHDVLGIWKQPKAENEVKVSYDRRITTETIDTMGIEKDFE